MERHRRNFESQSRRNHHQRHVQQRRRLAIAFIAMLACMNPLQVCRTRDP